MIRSLFLLISSVFVLLLSCHGGTIETTNGYTVAVVDEQGEAVQGAKVKMIPVEEWLEKRKSDEPVVADSTFTDAYGIATFEVLEDELVNIQVERGSDEGALLMNLRMTEGCADTLVLQPLRSVSGRVNATEGDVKWMMVEGTDLKAEVLENDSFHLKIPPATVSLFAGISVAGADTYAYSYVSTVDAESGQTTLDPITVDPWGILLDDFEDTTGTVYTADSLGEGRWYIVKSPSALIHNPDTFDFIGFLSTAGAFEGKSLSIPYTMDYDDYISTGFLLGNDSCYDISAFDTISFAAKGDGVVSLRLMRNDSYTEEQYLAWYDYQLTSSWTKVKIFPEMLNIRSADPTYSTWARFGRRIKKISFHIRGGSEFHLDNLRIEGIDIRDLTQN